MRRMIVAVVVVGLLSTSGYALADAPQKEKHQKTEKQKQQQQQQQKEKKPKQQHHNNGKQLLGDNVKSNGRHAFDKKGDYTAYADVKDGKITGVQVKHAQKGDVPVKKYKTNKKMAMGTLAPVAYASMQYGSQEYAGTVYIGYAYEDEFGDEVIYWFPYDMIYDGDTGAVEYVPAY
jgi:hypothetical protein